MAHDRVRDGGAGLETIRLVVSDIDGTLVRSDKSLAPATAEAVKRVRAEGIGFTLISARPPSGLDKLIEALGIEAPVGAFNGATIFRPGGAVIEANRVPEETARGVLAILKRHGIPAWVFADGGWITPTPDMPHVRQEIVASAREPIVAADPGPWLDRTDKVMGVCDDSARLAAAEAEVRAAHEAEATIARSQTYYLDVTAAGTDKGHGVRELARAFGVEPAEVAVLGDMPNDLPMFAVAGLAVAMGQAEEAVRAKAHRVTAGNDEDGVASFLVELAEARRGG